MSNIRPISLQNCLGKLFNKLLAYRLCNIFASHPILNPSQRGFILGGTISKCLDELLDVWDWSRGAVNKKHHACYTLFYDIKQAYDSVQVPVLLRALRRLHLPASFIALIRNSLTSLTSCIRTIYGPTRTFDVRRSLRQGDPLAPILFVILMDSLHDGLETNPFSGLQHGLKFLSDKFYLSSLGYADDTTITCNTLADLAQQNQWVQYWMRFQLLQLNEKKCELVGRDDTGASVTREQLDTYDIRINDSPIIPVLHSTPIRYLGAHSCFDGSWIIQQHKVLGTINKFTRVAMKFNLSIYQMIYMFNVFLLSKLEIPFHYVHGPQTTQWLHKCDRLLIGAIKHTMQSPLGLSHSMCAILTHLNLPSWLEQTIKVSELFLRMNSSSLDRRWGDLGRECMRIQCSSTINNDMRHNLHHRNSGTRLTRTALLSLKYLKWELYLNHTNRIGGRHTSIYQTLPVSDTPSILTSTATSIPPVQLIDDRRLHVVHDHWTGWGTSLMSNNIHVYSDGSYGALLNTSSWAVLVADKVFQIDFRSYPVDEKLIRAHHIDPDTSMFASKIINTSGIYPAELQGIARILAMFSLTHVLHIHTDSQSSIKAIQSYSEQLNERKRLRMASRPLLQLIHHLTSLRQAANGNVKYYHVKAHSAQTDLHSVGNRIVDYQANSTRLKSDSDYRPLPSTLLQLPLRQCEQHLCMINSLTRMQVIDDIRSTCLKQIKHDALLRWVDRLFKCDQSYFADLTIMMPDVSRNILRYGTHQQQISFMQCITNSIHFHWVDSELQQLYCNSCRKVLTISHLLLCPTSTCAQYRVVLEKKILVLLDECKSMRGRTLIRQYHRLPLVPLLMKLFPPSSSDDLTNDFTIRHLSSCMIGAYSLSDSKRLIQLLDIQSPNPAQDQSDLIHQQLRFCCLDQVGQLYEKWKDQFQ